jgi:hypothetical protein
MSEPVRFPGAFRDRVNINDGKPWSEKDVFDLRSAIWLGETIEQAADFLCRSDEEVAAKAKELGLSTTRH